MINKRREKLNKIIKAKQIPRKGKFRDINRTLREYKDDIPSTKKKSSTKKYKALKSRVKKAYITTKPLNYLLNPLKRKVVSTAFKGLLKGSGKDIFTRLRFLAAMAPKYVAQQKTWEDFKGMRELQDAAMAEPLGSAAIGGRIPHHNIDVAYGGSLKPVIY